MMRVSNPALFRARLVKLKMSRRELARQLGGMSPSYISDVAAGKKRIRTANAKLIAEIMQIPVAKLFVEADGDAGPATPEYSARIDAEIEHAATVAWRI
jgi:transcriptional regulator with XRE-family HTH domain